MQQKYKEVRGSWGYVAKFEKKHKKGDGSVYYTFSLRNSVDGDTKWYNIIVTNEGLFEACTQLKDKMRVYVFGDYKREKGQEKIFPEMIVIDDTKS